MIASIIEQRKRELFFFSASIIASALNYAVYPVISRLLTIDQLNSSIIFLNISSQLGGIFAISTILYTFLSIRFNKNEVAELENETKKALQKLFIASSTFILFLLVIARLDLQSMLLPFATILVLAYAGVIGAGLIGRVNAQGNFYFSGLFIISSSLLQLIISYFTLKYLRSDVLALILSFLIGYIIPLGFFILFARKINHTDVVSKTSLITRAHFRTAVYWGFFIYLLFWVGQSIDVYLIEQVQVPSLRDDLIVSSVYPKAVYFLGFVYIWTVLPKHARNRKISFSDIWRSITQLLVLSITAAVSILIFKNLFDHIIIGRSLNVPFATLSFLLLFKILYLVFSFILSLCLVRGLNKQLFTDMFLYTIFNLLTYITIGDRLLPALFISSFSTIVVSIKLLYTQDWRKWR